MQFIGSGAPLNGDGMDRVCSILGVTAAQVWAVLTVETAGFGFLKDRRPRILFERHIFRQLTNGRFDDAHPDISNRHRGGYIGGAGEYPRLERAMALDRTAALESASWGMGQVMGFNHRAAGFASAEAMVTAMVADETSQLAGMANFVKNEGLDAALRREDWAAFARGYNGPAFKENNYDTRLAAAHEEFKDALPDLTLRTAQAALTFLGFEPGPVDGLQGKRTRAALTKYQQSRGLALTGDLSADTAASLFAEAFPLVGIV